MIIIIIIVNVYLAIKIRISQYYIQNQHSKYNYLGNNGEREGNDKQGEEERNGYL